MAAGWTIHKYTLIFSPLASAGILVQAAFVFAKCHSQLKLVMLRGKGHTPTCVAKWETWANSDTWLDKIPGTHSQHLRPKPSDTFSLLIVSSHTQ